MTSFSRKDLEGVMAHENDPMVIKLQICDWIIKRVLINPRSSADVLYMEAFKGMNFDTTELLPFKGTLVEVSAEHVQVLGHLPIMTTFGSRDHAKSIQVRYVIINVASPYNIIIGRPLLNALKATLSILYLTLKYPLEDGRVGIVKGGQGIARKYYKDSLRLKRMSYFDEPIKGGQLKVNLINIDPREELPKNQLTHRGNTKKMQNNVRPAHPTQIRASQISKDEDGNLESI